MKVKRQLAGLGLLAVLVLFSELVLYDWIADNFARDYGTFPLAREIIAILGTFLFMSISATIVRWWA